MALNMSSKTADITILAITATTKAATPMSRWPDKSEVAVEALVIAVWFINIIRVMRDALL